MADQPENNQNQGGLDPAITPEIDRLLGSENPSMDELEALLDAADEDALIDEPDVTEKYKRMIRSYFPAIDGESHKPERDDDVWVVEGNNAPQRVYERAWNLVIAEQNKDEGVVILQEYKYGLGFVFSCPKDVQVIPINSKDFKGLEILKNPEVKD